MEDKLFELRYDLRLAEKRIQNMEKKTKREEEQIYDKMVNALMEGDRDAAKDYARMYLRIKRKRKTFRKYLSRIKNAKMRLREASAFRKTSKELVKTAQTLSKTKEAASFTDLVKATEELEKEESELPPRASSVTEDKVEGILDEAQLEASAETEEILPKIPDHVKEESIQENKESEENEEREESQ